MNAKKTKDGYIEGIVFDKYDYKLLLKEFLKDFIGPIYNNGALFLQKIKHLENYYYFIPVRIKY